MVAYDRPKDASHQCQYDLWVFNSCPQASKML